MQRPWGRTGPHVLEVCVDTTVAGQGAQWERCRR